MKRAFVFGVIAAIGSLSLSARALQQAGPGAGAPKVLEVEKLRDNLFVLKGPMSGGNTAVFIQSNGVTVVDTKNPGWGAPILAKIKELTNKPVTTIINTHTHGDHVSGNVEFPATVDVVAHANAAASMQKMASPPGMPPNATNIFTEHNGRGMPKKTFTDRMTLGTGADRIDLLYFGRGHTNGDAWVVFPALRVAHSGDIFARKGIPLLDSNNGGSGVALPDTLQKAHDGLSDVDQIITGHSTVMTRADLKEYADMNRDFLEMVRAAKKDGRPAEQVGVGWTYPARYTGYEPIDAARLKINVEITYKELP